jgi:pimeloyl-ACP methyl ester carboxylesterase
VAASGRILAVPDLADEFALLRENADEAGLPWREPPVVERVAVGLPDGRSLRALRWGSGPPEVVLLHGGAQNAHTWDTVALAMDRPLVAIDLPGHGRSDWRDDHHYSPPTLAADVEVAVRELAPEAELLVGMSLGGLTALCLTARAPDLVRRLAVVDVTPGTDRAKAEPIITFVSGPERFGSFDELLERTVAHNPTRSVSSLRRGVLHNATEDPDGSWRWRWDPEHLSAVEGDVEFGDLWSTVDAVRVPFLLLRGALSGVVDDDDVAEVRRRVPSVRVEVVEGAGHSIQGDQPVELARLLNGFAAS